MKRRQRVAPPVRPAGWSSRSIRNGWSRSSIASARRPQARPRLQRAMNTAAQHSPAIAGPLPAYSEFEIEDEDFKFLVREVHRRTGIVISDRKRPMLCGRLSRRLRALGLDSFRAYCEMLAGPH